MWLQNFNKRITLSRKLDTMVQNPISTRKNWITTQQIEKLLVKNIHIYIYLNLSDYDTSSHKSVQYYLICNPLKRIPFSKKISFQSLGATAVTERTLKLYIVKRKKHFFIIFTRKWRQHSAQAAFLIL